MSFVEEAVELGDYLPLSFRTTSEQEYVVFLWESFESNYASGKYQFAFLVYHMLTMCFVYFSIWQIKQTRPEDFQKAMVGFSKDLENELLNAESPFALWRVGESAVMRFFKLTGCDNDKVGNYVALVRDRNDTAHANGNIFFSTQAALDAKIAVVLRLVEEIQKHSAPLIADAYRTFLLNNFDAEEREYPDGNDQVREMLIHKNYLSRKDVDECLAFDVGALADHSAFDRIRVLHETLLAEYAVDDE